MQDIQQWIISGIRWYVTKFNQTGKKIRNKLEHFWIIYMCKYFFIIEQSVLFHFCSINTNVTLKMRKRYIYDCLKVLKYVVDQSVISIIMNKFNDNHKLPKDFHTFLQELLAWIVLIYLFFGPWRTLAYRFYSAIWIFWKVDVKKAKNGHS